MWARFDDNYDSNPKIVQAGRDAKNLHEASIRWSCRLRTNGKIPKPVLTELAVLAQLPGRRSLHHQATDRLVAFNLWEDHGDHWMIHDFSDYAPPQRFVKPQDRSRENHGARDSDHGLREGNHGPRDPVSRPVPVPSDEDLAVFTEWASTMPQPSRTVFTAPRRKAVEKARAAGYSQDDLLDCVRGWVNDPWEGRAQQNDMEQLLRKVEKFRDLWRNGKPAAPSQSQAVRNAMTLMGRTP